MKSMLLFLFVLFFSCNNPNVVSKPPAAIPPPDHTLAKKRLTAKTLTDFLAIGYQIDTVVKNYASLKYDSIEAINYLNTAFSDIKEGESIDTILKRHVLNPPQVAHLVQVLDSEKTYDLGYKTKCFVPHLMFVFYSQDTIVAHCSVCFHCMNMYSTLIKSEVNMSEYGDTTLSKFCKELNFSDCQRD